MKYIFQNKFLIIISLLVICGCEFGYEPNEVPDITDNNNNQDQASGDFKIFEINKNKQICNPSISQNEDSYPGCMLWLGFSGDLNVNTSQVTGYDLPARMHDRLTISDTSNNVKWFLKNTDIGLERSDELQDPEWATHPDYVVFLANNASKFDGVVARISDKAYLKLTKNSLNVDATPHLFVPDSAKSAQQPASPEYYSNGFVKKEYVETFFGTDQVKYVYTKPVNGLTIYCIDYSEDIPEPFQLQKPEGKDNWNCESPLISNDGNWIVYNCYNQGSKIPYFQKLNSASTPKKVADEGYAPHWWKDPFTEDHYIIYTQLEGDIFVTADLTTESASEGAEGATYKVRLTGTMGDVPTHMGPNVTNDITVVCKLPMKGGLSRSGNYICTGYDKAYIVFLY